MFTQYSLLRVLICALSFMASSAVAQQHGKGPMGRGPGRDPAFAADRDLFHSLLRNREVIHREVKKTEHGVETRTESDNPEVALMIQKHVTSMKKRVEENRPIHLRDPLFAQVFEHSAKIKMDYVKTKNGVIVTETSDDPYAVKLIQKHAEVVSLFIKYGFDEVHRNHDPPSKAKEVQP